MDVKVVNVRIGPFGAVANVVDAESGEMLIIADIKTLVNFCQHKEYRIVNTQEMIESVGEALGKMMSDWTRFRNKLNS